MDDGGRDSWRSLVHATCAKPELVVSGGSGIGAFVLRVGA